MAQQDKAGLGVLNDGQVRAASGGVLHIKKDLNKVIDACFSLAILANQMCEEDKKKIRILAGEVRI